MKIKYIHYVRACNIKIRQKYLYMRRVNIHKLYTFKSPEDILNIENTEIVTIRYYERYSQKPDFINFLI